jgi:hypothetical protein
MELCSRHNQTVQQTQSNCAADTTKLCSRHNQTVQQTQSNCAADTTKLCSRHNQTVQQTQSNCALTQSNPKALSSCCQHSNVPLPVTLHGTISRYQPSVAPIRTHRQTAQPVAVCSLPAVVSSGRIYTQRSSVWCAARHTSGSAHPATVPKRCTLTPRFPSCFCRSDSRCEAGDVTDAA